MQDAALFVAILACISSVTPIAGLYARARLAPLDDPDTAMVAVIDNVLGVFAGGIVGIAVLFAIQSTANSLLHTIASAISHDLRGALSQNVPAYDSSVLRTDRMIVAAVGVLGLLATLYAPPFMLVWLGIVGTGTLIASLAAPVLLPAVWLGNANGALAALVSGFATSASLLVYFDANWIEGPLLGCLAGCVAYVLVSMATFRFQPRVEETQ